MNIVAQRGASLFLALIVLLVLSILAVGSMRGVAVENRMTAFLQEEKLYMSQAEAISRAADSLIQQQNSALDECTENTAASVCITAEQEDDFKTYYVLPCLKGQCLEYNAEGLNNQDTQLDSKTKGRWYVQLAPVGDAEQQSVNPEYGEQMKGIGTFFYEVTAIVEAAEKETKKNAYIRSVVSKTFN